MGKPRRQNQMSKVKIRPPNLLFKLKELIPQLTAEGRTEKWQAERKSATALNSSSGVYAQYEALASR